MGVYSLYFSPTGGTKRVMDALVSQMDAVREIDLSEKEGNGFTYGFQPEDVCFIGVPSFGGRVPRIALERLQTIYAGGAKAVLAVVYGNRDYDDTMLELKDTAESCGFVVVAAVAAVAEHSIVRAYGRGRPDTADIAELNDFSGRIRKLLQEETPHFEGVPGKRPYRPYGGVPLKPAAGEACVKCGLCAKKCPAGAIPSEDPSRTDAGLCISCMRCISVCPVKARRLDPAAVEATAQKLKEKCAKRKPNEFFC